MANLEQMDHLTPADRLSIRVAVAALEMLKGAAGDLGLAVEDLDAEAIARWVAARS